MKYLSKIVILFFTILLAFYSYAQDSNEQMLASQYFQNEEYDKAALLYEKLFSTSSSQYYYSAYLNCLIQLEGFKKAQKLVKQQIKKNPGRLNYLVDLGYLLKLDNDLKGSEKKYTKAIASLTENPTSIYELAAGFYDRKEYKFAIATYLRGRKLVRNELVFVYEVAELYYILNQRESMIEEYLIQLYFNSSQLEEVQNLLQEKLTKKQDFNYLQTSLLKKIQKYSSKPVYAELLIWHYVQLKDFDAALIQAKALDRRYKEDGSRILVLANICLSNLEYKTAVKAIHYVINKGPDCINYMIAHRDLLRVKKNQIDNSYQINSEDVLSLDNDYDNFIDKFGKNNTTASVLAEKSLLKAYYQGNYDEAVQILEEVLKLARLNPFFVGRCKLDLGDVYLVKGEVWESTLYYSQVDKAFKDDAIAHEARLKNAKLSFYNGDFEWAQIQLDILKSATSELIANNALNLSLLIMDNLSLDTTAVPIKMYAKADLLVFQRKEDEALKMLDSLSDLFPEHNLADEILYTKAKIYKKRGEFDVALNYYQKIIDNYPDDILADDAIYEAAMIYETHQKDNNKAMELYQKILTTYPGSLLVLEARKRFRELRGDYVN